MRPGDKAGWPSVPLTAGPALPCPHCSEVGTGAWVPPAVPGLSHQGTGLDFCTLEWGLEVSESSPGLSGVPKVMRSPRSGRQPHPLGPSWRPGTWPSAGPGLSPACSSVASVLPPVALGLFAADGELQEGGWAVVRAQTRQLTPLPRARPRRAAPLPPSAAPVGSAAGTCTWCSDTWLTGSSTIGAASGGACVRVFAHV